MTFATDALPNDPQALKAPVSAQRAEIERLKMMIAKLRRMQFGRSSEQLDAMIDQLQLSLEELQISQTELTPPTEPPPRTVSRRKPLPDHLPREIHVHQPETQCTGCCGKLRHLGENVSEVLEYVPARFKVIRQCVRSGFADAASTSRNHPEHESMLEWHGSTFDPTVFEWERVNQWLKEIKI